MAELQCYNKGCGKKYTPDEDTSDACIYHPGDPIFHDAYKGWACCNKRSTDFTTFLNMKGCATGRHNPEKPVEPEKPKCDQMNKDEVITVEAPRITALPRPSFNTPMKRLPATISQSLKQAIEKKKQEQESEQNNDDTETIGGVRVGENCKNNGCKKSYENEHSNLDLCQYHPGIPIFHEGMKYWSCCNKKTTDFQEFLEQQGCSSGHHVWHKLEKTKEAACRYDWHQTGTHICISIYAKLCDSVNSYVDLNPIRLCANIVFGDAEIFKLDVELTGIVDVDQSNVNLAASKVEIKLRKGEPKTWRNLNIEKKVETSSSSNKTDDEKAGQDLECMVNAVDLSDL